MYLFVTPSDSGVHPESAVDNEEEGFLPLYFLKERLRFSRNLLIVVRFNNMVGAVGFEPTTDRL